MAHVELSSTNDLLLLVAECLRTPSEDAYSELLAAQSIVWGWMQPDQERDAQLSLIEAAMQVLEQIVD